MRDDFGRQLGLDGKYVLDPAVVTARPEMRTAARIDQLRHHAKLVPGAPGTAFDHIAGAQPFADEADVFCLTAQGEGRIAGNHLKLGVSRQIGDYILGKPVGEIALLGVAAHIVEGQHRNRRPCIGEFAARQAREAAGQVGADGSYLRRLRCGSGEDECRGPDGVGQGRAPATSDPPKPAATVLSSASSRTA